MNRNVAGFLALQSGVIARHQAITAGLTPNDIRRLMRRREWAMVHPGVYVNHTGSLTWLQRAWAGVLCVWPAALCDESALRAAEGPGKHERSDEGTIHLGIDRHRGTLVAPTGTSLHHLTDVDDRVQWNLGPPRLRYEEAAIDVATRAGSELDAIAGLAKACQSRRTTAARLAATLANRERVPQRRWLEGILRDVAEGTCSVLEHAYLERIERAHGFPGATRQARATASTGIVYRDVPYGMSFLVELDGRLNHDSISHRDADFERDLDAAVDGSSTVRLSLGQVFDRPCSTTAKLVVVLRAHGVIVTPHGCGVECPVGTLALSA